MKRTLVAIILFALLAAAPCTAQWRNIGWGELDGSAIGHPLSFGVHDTSLFVSISDEGGHLFRLAGGVQWLLAESGIDFSQGAINSFASLGRYFFAGSDAIFRSSNNGTRWDTLQMGAPVGTNGSYLYGNAHKSLYRSVDSGDTWQLVGAISANRFAAIGACIFTNTSKGTYRSTDSGSNWFPLSTPSGLSLSAFASIGSNIFAGGAGVWRSMDSGTAWPQHTLTDRAVTALASYRQYLFAGTDTGVFISFDTGKSWRNVSDGLGAQKVGPGAPYHPKVVAFAVLNTLLYASIDAGNSGGVQFAYGAKRSIPEMLDTTLAAVAQMPLSSDTIAIYPNPATGLVTILVGGGYASIERVSVLSVLGVEVLTLDKPGGMSHNSEITLDLSHLPSGTYFVRIQTASGSVLRKVVRE